MFYCNKCASKRQWPSTLFKSEGPCEICEKVRLCNDLPSSMLPLPEKKTKEEAVNENEHRLWALPSTTWLAESEPLSFKDATFNGTMSDIIGLLADNLESSNYFLDAEETKEDIIMMIRHMEVIPE